MTYVDERGYHCHLICLPIGYERLNERFAWSNPEKRYINKAVLLLLYSSPARQKMFNNFVNILI